MVSFSEISPTTRTPFVYLEFDASRATQGVPAQPYKGLLVGQRRAGSIPVLTPARISSPSQAAAYFGVGSQLHQMAVAWFANNQETETWAIGVADPAGTAATGSIAFGGSATENGTIAAYVGGRRYPVAVVIAASTSALATALAAAVNADTSAPVTATAFTNTVTFTARHVGVIGNDIDVRVSYLDGETVPAGATATPVAMSGGAGDPTISAIWAPLGDQWFNVMVIPFTDATNLTAIETELASRAGASRHIGGLHFACKAGTLATVQTLGNARNSPRSSIMGTNASPTLPWECASAIGGQSAKALSNDAARPLQTLPLIGMLAPLPTDRWTQAQRNSNLFSGITTFTVAADGTCQIERAISTYKLNAQGGADAAWLDVNTAATADFLRWDFVNYVSGRYPRHKLANDGTQFASGQLIVTPSLMRAELIGRFRQWEGLGLVEDFEQFKRDLIVERSTQDPSRLDILLSPNFVNGLRVVAARLAFIV